MMSDDDDDDGVEPQIEDVNEYHFEDGDGEPVCFSILPFQFGENDNEADFFRKNVFLHGFVDKSLPVYKKVVAWKIRLDTEQPNIYVLSIQHKWIKLLKPRKCYGEFARSILITVQMLHFVRRGGQRSLNHLWDRLDEVSGKFNPKPATDDLMKHQNLIKLFVEKDQTLMKSKILQRLIENRFKRTKKALGLEAQVIVSSTRRVRKNDDNNYGNKDGSGDDCDDGDGSSNGDESSDDDDESSDDDERNDDDGTDQICAICDDGGQLLSCEGSCKRSFHATKKDGRESKCETLGYTSAEVKRMGTFLCANCKKKQHQCSSCGELEPSHGPNAKVFQCNKASCGYFYHPKCIAQLLDPNATDRACELERRIMTGMSFRCPIHWCFKCGRMENKTQRALQLAVCRRCPKAYHRECLPRELSLGAKDKDGNPRAWELSKTIFIYCLDHEIDKDIGAASRNHIKFPATPECTKTKKLGNSKGRMTGKRRKNTDQSTKPTELSNRLCGAESEQADNVGAKSTSPQIVVEPHCAAKLLKGDPQIEQSIIGVAASQNGAETMKGHEKQFGISSCVASTETEKRVTCSAGTPYDGRPSTKGMSDCSVQDTPVDRDVELDNVACRITEDKYANGREKTQEGYTRKETAHHKDSSENQGQNDVLGLGNLWVDIQADGSPLEPGNKRDKEWQENAYGLGSILGQEKETSSRRENPQSDRGMVPRNDSQIIDYRKGGTTVDTGTASRNHIQFPTSPECTKTKELGNSKGRMTGRRRKNTDQSIKPTELSNRLCGAESEQADNVGAKSTSPQIVVEPHCVAKRFKDDPQIEQSIIGVGASQNGAEIMNGHEKQFGISSRVASTETEKRVPYLAQKGTCLGTPYDGPSTKDMSDCSVQDTPVDKDVELDNVACRIMEDKYANGREKTQEDYTRKETAHRKDSSENQGQNDVLELDNLWVEIQADGSPLEPGNKRDKEENAHGLRSASGQEKETSSKRENPESDRGMVPMNNSKTIHYRKGGTTLDNVDDHSSEGSYQCQVECNCSKCNDGLVAIDQDTSSDRSKRRSQPVEKASDGNKMYLDKDKRHNLKEDGRDAHYEDRRTERNTAADTSRYKCRDKIQLDRREQELVGRYTRARSSEHSPERQRMERDGSYPGTYNRRRYESLHNFNPPRSGCDDRRQLSPCQSSFPLPEFCGDHSHLYPRDSTSRRHNPHRYMGIPQYRPYMAASAAGHSAVCYRLAGGYGEGSRASRPVTDWYAPHLDRTNCQPRSQIDLQLQASRPVTDKYAPQLELTNYPPRSQSDLQYCTTTI